MDGIVTRRVLMIAYHFPPILGSSGIERTLRFARYLPELGWEPTVLTVHSRAYPETSPDRFAEVPEGIAVHRAFGLDSARHLNFFGAYPQIVALPDRWATWWLGAVPAGLRLARRLKPQAIWSTYPIATAHLIGLTLHRMTGIPWVADFRDPMAQDGYPADPRVWKSFHWIERQTLRHCTRAVFTTPGTVRWYRQRYPELAADKLSLIENGYDEEVFAGLEPRREGVRGRSRPLVLVHSGIVYPSERDPRALFAAIADLQRTRAVGPGDLQIVLRATGNDAHIDRLIRDAGVSGIVRTAPAVPYRTALTEMIEADGLLLLQASNCNNQIPAKLYEYLRAERPILALTDPIGDTAAALRAAGVDTVAPLDSAPAIAAGLSGFLAMIREDRAPVPVSARVALASRRARSVELAGLLDSLAERG